MRRILSVILFISLFPVAYSQVIRGTIFDGTTDSIIYFATVYFNGTSVGTVSDKNGHFELDISKYKSMPLTISALGYYSVTLKNYSTGKSLAVYLNPKVYDLNEVMISANRKASNRKRERYLRFFRKEFLGETSNAFKCEITNENDILFSYDAESQTLRAFASKPLLIDNKSLGYHLTYFLDRFEFCDSTNHLIYLGNCIFKDDSLVISKSSKETIAEKRESAYLGSRMHFFRSLWENKLDLNGFSMFTLIKIEDSYDWFRFTYANVVFQSDSLTKYLKHMGELKVRYRNKWGGESSILTIKDSVQFDKHGYFDPLRIKWQGDMVRQRIGDLLPYEYSEKKQQSD
jgi:hypothetical protein